MKRNLTGNDLATDAQLAPSSCWASSLADCDQKLTREHVVSQCLFDTDQIMVQGFPWCLNEPKSMSEHFRGTSPRQVVCVLPYERTLVPKSAARATHLRLPDVLRDADREG